MTFGMYRMKVAVGPVSLPSGSESSSPPDLHPLLIEPPIYGTFHLPPLRVSSPVSEFKSETAEQPSDLSEPCS